MRRTAVLAAVLPLLAAAVAGCRSATAPTPVAPPATAPRPAAADSSTGAAAAADTVRDALDDLLARAARCAATGDRNGFEQAESAILLSLTDETERTGCTDDSELIVAEVLDELEALAGALQPVDGIDELPPPEPEPVPDERVDATRNESAAARYDLPVVVNAEVTSLIDYYTGPHRDRFVATLARAGWYLPDIRRELAAAGLPEDLAFLPVVESAFNPSARSRARAQGLWQFMKGTARLYGLRCDALVDERNDPYLATSAAVAHLRDLYAHFGDWTLALAAYNSGRGRVDRAIRRAGGERDFWRIRRYLPRETRNYVPALWAVLVAVRNPEAFGLDPIEEHPACVARVEVDGALDLSVLADRGPVDGADLVELNPALTYGLTPARGSYRLAVPCGTEDAVVAAIAAIPPGQRVRRFVHEVRSGDTIGALARRYGSSSRAIMNANGIRDPRRLRIGRKLVIPRDPSGGRVVTAAANGRYVVRRGDTLFSIARRYGLTVETLRRVNNLSGSLIRPGDVLQLD